MSNAELDFAMHAARAFARKSADGSTTERISFGGLAIVRSRGVVLLSQALVAAEQEIALMRAALDAIQQHYELRSELYTSDADLAAAMYDFARRAP